MAQFSNSGSGSGSGSNDKFSGNKQIQLEIPHNPEAEEAVLGSLLIDRDLIALVAPVLEPYHFFNRERSGIYRALLNLYVKEVPGDLVTVRNELKTMQLLGERPEMVSSTYLLKLMQATPTPVHALYYTNILHNFWLARKLIVEGSRMVASSYGGPNKASEILAENLERM
jgi:replicative DNA helicase